MNPPDIELHAYKQGKMAHEGGIPTFEDVIRGYEAYYYTPQWFEVRRVWDAYQAGKADRQMPTVKSLWQLVVDPRRAKLL